MSGTTCAWYSVPCRLGLPLDQYQVNFALLVGLCAGLFSAQQTQQARVAASSAAGKDKTNGSTAKAKHGTSEVASDRSGASQLSFLIVYALVMAADWLQGPFLYSLYAKEHAVAPTVIPQLFTTGFVSGGVAGAVVGSLADAYGRRAACLAFCVAYTVSCLLTAGPPSLPLLFLGRVLGGISTSLLFSVFEGWMVADFARRNLESKGGVLSKTFARMSTVNSVVAIASGVVSEWLVAAAGTRKAPFWASSVLLVLAGVVIAATWEENYGETSSPKSTSTKAKQGEQTRDDSESSATSLLSVFANPRILSLGLAGTMFEGSMYLFVFFWAPALQSARAAASPGVSNAAAAADLPFGIIFACFMAAMTAASLAFGLVAAKAGDHFRPAHLLVVVMATATFSFWRMSLPAAAASAARSALSPEQSSFWLFCLFEACVGLYWPCVGLLRGQVVPDAVRARVYAWLRVPLNVFVVVSLLLTRNTGSAGEKAEGFRVVFATCAKLLLASTVTLWGVVARSADAH